VLVRDLKGKGTPRGCHLGQLLRAPPIWAVRGSGERAALRLVVVDIGIGVVTPVGIRRVRVQLDMHSVEREAPRAGGITLKVNDPRRHADRSSGLRPRALSPGVLTAVITRD
jgi:hypothetical protein